MELLLLWLYYYKDSKHKRKGEHMVQSFINKVCRTFRRHVPAVFLLALCVSFLVPVTAKAASGAIWPAGGVITTRFNDDCPGYKFHQGMDIAKNDSSAPIFATQSGSIIAAGYEGALGNRIIIAHVNGWTSVYAHLSSFVRTSGSVTQGELIGRMGSTGQSTGTHLHFVMKKDGVSQNFNSAIGCGQTASARSPINYNFSGLSGSGIENVKNGGGTHLVGTNGSISVSSRGQVYAWNATHRGGTPGGYSGRFVDAKPTANNGGYWLLTSTGQVYSYGNARYHGGSPTGKVGEIVAMAGKLDGTGYAMVSSSGQVYAYGSVGYRGGSPSGYAGKFVDIEITPDGGGYWLLTSAGQVYAYGNASYHGGSPSGFSKAIVALSPTVDGKGYVMVSKTGQVYAYGNAQYKGGSPSGYAGEFADISYRTDGGHGYAMITTRGQHYSYSAPYLGNPRGFAGIF